MKLEFSLQIFEKLKISSLIKPVQCESDVFLRTDGQPDVKLVVVLRNFANAPRNEYW